jgi:hypothetical protein
VTTLLTSSLFNHLLPSCVEQLYNFFKYSSLIATSEVSISANALKECLFQLKGVLEKYHTARGKRVQTY